MEGSGSDFVRPLNTTGQPVSEAESDFVQQGVRSEHDRPTGLTQNARPDSFTRKNIEQAVNRVVWVDGTSFEDLWSDIISANSGGGSTGIAPSKMQELLFRV
jgi:tartrate dehydratase alpha subunit/fumarate hydratase class I-like protein